MTLLLIAAAVILACAVKLLRMEEQIDRLDRGTHAKDRHITDLQASRRRARTELQDVREQLSDAKGRPDAWQVAEHYAAALVQTVSPTAPDRARGMLNTETSQTRRLALEARTWLLDDRQVDPRTVLARESRFTNGYGNVSGPPVNPGLTPRPSFGDLETTS